MISIVVCTRNRAAFLPSALAAYAGIKTHKEWELILVNNNSTDDTGKVLADFAKSATFPVVIVDELKRGVSNARNAGWRRATGEVIAFSDDDCYPKEDFIDAIAECFEEPVGYIGGQVLLYDPLDYPITIQTLDVRVPLPQHQFIESGLIHGANLAARRDVLTSLNGFDPLLGAGTNLPGGDDTDFVNRASFNGYAGAYDPRPKVQHHHRRRTAEQARKLMKGYNIGRGACYTKAVLDKKRRSQVSRQWYWRTLLPALSSRHNFLKLLHEMRGSLMYLLVRLKSQSAKN